MAKTKTGTNGKNEILNRKVAEFEDREVEVLYQKMGDRWFAFSLVDDEIFVGSIPQEIIDQADLGRSR